MTVHTILHQRTTSSLEGNYSNYLIQRNNLQLPTIVYIPAYNWSKHRMPFQASEKHCKQFSKSNKHFAFPNPLNVARATITTSNYVSTGSNQFPALPPCNAERLDKQRNRTKAENAKTAKTTQHKQHKEIFTHDSVTQQLLRDEEQIPYLRWCRR